MMNVLGHYECPKPEYKLINNIYVHDPVDTEEVFQWPNFPTLSSSAVHEELRDLIWLQTKQLRIWIMNRIQSHGISSTRSGDREFPLTPGPQL